jgi:hypothetical protein
MIRPTPARPSPTSPAPTSPAPTTTESESPVRRDRRTIVTGLIVALATMFVVWTMSPWAWFVDTTPTGGDMGAHVWSPAFLRDELLPNFRLTGWSPDWYAGFPAFTFYMVLPSLAIVIVNVGIGFDFGVLQIDADFYSFVGLVLGARELARRLRADAGVSAVVMAGAAAFSIAMSWRYDGRRLDPGRILPWSPVDPFTYNDASMDLAIAGIVLPLAVGSLVHHLARGQGRWRGLITAVAVVATILVVPIPYGVAMKLVAISGIVTLPVAAYAAGRLGGLAYPGPALMSVMTLPFLFDRSYNIYGGNVMSTMAGEFAYSIGLSVAVLYVGVAAHGMRTGRHRALAGGLLALAGLTHLFAAFFAIVATVALFVVRPGRRETSWLAVAGPLGGLLAAFWVLPFAWNAKYLNDMGWGKERDYVAALWSRGGNFGGHEFLVNELPLQLFVVLAVVGAIISGIRRVRLGMALTLIAGMFAIAFFLLPETRLWNVRILPFYYLSIYLLAGVAIAETARLVADFLRTPDQIRLRQPTWTAGIPAALVALVITTVLAFPLRSLPFGSLYVDDGTTEYGLDWDWLGNQGTPELNLGPGWMRYNFTGYEQRATVEEYRNLVATMDRVGQTFGCGQSLWEYDGDRLGGYGTPMAPMLLPHWTDGCIGSMEGLYFEASATTPYHFLLQSELSTGPSRAMRDMPYSPLSVEKGVDGLRTLGVRYYMAATDQAITQARDQGGLTEIATSGPWVIFMVNDQSVVQGLDRLPVVVDGVDAGGEEWLIPTVAWWEAGPDTPLVAASGPGSWPRSSLDDLLATEPGYATAVETGDRVEVMRRLAELAPSWLPQVDADVAQVRNVEVDVASISFEVDRIGSPVLVRTSYFPNWEVAGADGPYRVAPNLMVVVPTDTNVELTYGRSNIELVAMALTLLGVLAAFISFRVPVASPRGRLWDLGDPGPSLPARDTMLDDVRAGVVGAAAVAEINEEVDSRQRAGLFALGASLVLFGWSAMFFAAAKLWSEGLVPGGDKPGASIVVLGPAVVGLVVLFFVSLPILIETAMYRSSVIRPAELLADVINADERPDVVEDEPVP